MADTDSIIVRTGKDLKLDNAIQVGSNESVALPGTIRYNSNADRFEGYVVSTNPYNNSKWALMSLGIASDTTLGGVKIGNNLGITSDGILNATAEAVSQKVQRILLIAKPSNAGDYTSINQCITQFFGYDPINNTFPNGELANLNKTNYPDPSPQNRYVIKVTPGIYSESDTTITLPPYVSLIGENRADCIIKIDANISIECRASNYISNLTIDLTNANNGTAGIVNPIGILAATSAHSVTINGVDFVVSQLATPTTFITYRDGVTNGIIENCRITATNLALPSGYTNETITGIVCNNSIVDIHNTIIDLDGYRASKTALKVQNGANVTGSGLQINVTELNTTSSGHLNDAILITNADLELNYSQVSCQGYDILLDDDTHQCQAINMTSDSVAATVTLSDLQFIHYEDSTQYDEILVEESTQDFAELFSRDSYIKITGATSVRNKRIFQIANIYTETISGTLYSIIQLVSGYTLEDETVSSGSITIKELYLVQLNSSRITSTNATLRFTPSTNQVTHLDNYQIISSRTLLNGGDPNVGANNLRTDRLQLITVGHADSDFTSLKTAVDSISARADNSAEKPYVINIRPGKYLETGTIALPNWVAIIGDSVGATEVEFNSRDGDYAQNTAITIGNNNTIENITLRVNTTLDSDSSQSNVTVISTNNLTGIILGNTSSESGASTIDNVRLLNLNIIIGPNIDTTGQRHGLHLFKATADIRDVHITGTTADIDSASQVIVGYKQSLGNTQVYNLDVNISGSESNVSAYGAMLDRSFITANNPQILCSCNGTTDVVNRAWFATNLANTDNSVLTVSGFTNILVAGSVRASGSSTTNQCLFADYNSTIVARSLLMQGTAFTYNDSQNSVPNSFLKTLDSYFISISGGLITNISESDTRGYPVIINDSLHIGDPAGALGAQGEKNVIVGIRAGTRSTQTTRTTILGVDTGDQVETGTDVTYLGYGTGANTLGSLNVMIGSNAGFTAVDSERVVVAGANAYSDGNNMNDSVVLGPYAGSNVYNSNNLILVGANVSPNVDDAIDLVVMGAFAGSNITGLSNSVIMGSRSGNKLTSSGDDSVIIGHEAGQSIESARTITVVGSQAGQFAVQALDNTLVGYRAGRGVSSGATGNKITAVGVRTASAVTSGAELVAIGTGALQSVTGGRRVIAIGSELLTSGSGSGPAAALTLGQDDTIIGSNSATVLTTGDRVIVMGHHSGNKLDGTNDMIIIGNNSGSNFSGENQGDGQSIVIGNQAGVKQQQPRAIIIGHEAAQNANAEDLLAIGYKTGRAVKGAGNMIMGNFAAGITNDDVAAPLSGTYNVVMGNYAGFSMSTGSFNVVIGGGNQSLGSAGYDLTTGDGNVLMGYLSGRNLSTGDFNVLLGKNAGQQLAWGSRNFIMGSDAGSNIGITDVNPSTISNDNLILGTQAAFKYTSGSQLLIVGYQAGYNGTTGQNSVIVGNQAGFTNQVGRDIVYIGNKSGYLNTNSRNIAIGDGAAEYSSSAERFVYIGYRAGRGKGADVSVNNTGDRSVMIGYQAGSNVTTGYQDVYIGYEAGMNNEEGQKNIMIGPNSGRDSTTNRSVFIGTTESSTTGIGQQASGDNLICIGVNTGVALTTGTESVLIGSHAGESVTTGNSHVFIGNDAGRDVTTGNSSIYIGELAGKSSVSGNRNIAIGKNAGRDIGISVNDVILLGTESGLNAAADGTIAVGNKAAKMLRTGLGVIAIGDEAARDNETASDLIAIGTGAGRLTTGVDGESDSILIGDQAGSNLTTSYQNTVLGSRALKDATTANAVIAIGFEAGQHLGSTNNVKPSGSQYETTIIGYQAVSGGDIGANCTIIGNRAAQNVDNPRVFEGNTFNGPRAGQNANTSVNSVVLGGANQQGSGGVSNFIAGTSTGENVGIGKIPIAGAITTTTTIANRGMNVVVSAPLSSVYYYFKEGDSIMIEDSDQSQFHQTSVASLAEVTTTTTRIVFSTPFIDSTDSGETISTGASIRQVARLSELIGELDNSKASANTLQGTEAGISLDEGSKNVAAGYQSMFKNTKGKYNNVFGAQAAYNLRTDGSTCIGTRAGFSLDQYTYTNNTNGVDFTFDSNTNTISSETNNLNGYVFGTVFDVEGSSRNDGRYTTVNSNANTVVVQGSPRLEEIGVPIGIVDTDIRINANTYDFTGVSINGIGLKAVHGAELLRNLSPTTDEINSIRAFGGNDDTSNIAKILQFANSNIITITGSKFNDGLYYIGYRTDFTNYTAENVLYSDTYFHSEVFDANVTITAKNIRASDGITNGNDFNDLGYLAPLYITFGLNKGQYRINDNLPIPALRPTSNVSAVIESDILISQLNNTNDIFSTGYLQSINYTNNSSEYYKPSKIHIYGTIKFFASNNNIVFSKGINLTTALEGYYSIRGTNNNNGQVRLNSVTDNNTVYRVNNDVILVDETVNADSSNIVTFSSSYFKQLTSDLSDKYVTGQLARIQVEHTIGTTVDKGVYIVSTGNVVSSNYTLSLIDNQKIPEFYDNYSVDFNVTLNRDVKLLINPDTYRVDLPYIKNVANHIHSNDLFFQTTNIAPHSGSFSLVLSNSSIIADNDYQFTRLVAPCVVKCSDNKYYLIKKNDYPFRRLVIDNIKTPVSADNTLTYVNTHSICINRPTSNLGIMQPGLEYQIFGGNNNDQVKVIPVTGDARAIQSTSVYLTDTSLINEYISNDRVISLTATKYQTPDLTTLGHFKHLQFDATNVDFEVNLKTWAERTAIDGSWYAVTYGEPSGNPLFVAVGTNKFMTSPDGITWTNRTTIDSGWYDVTYGTPAGNPLFVAVGEGSKVMTSSDGITWTERTAIDGSWYGVTYGITPGTPDNNPLFVAVGWSSKVMTSPDGITWTQRTAIAGDWAALTYGTPAGNPLFVAVTWSIVMTSPDGITWTEQTSVVGSWVSVTYGTPGGNPLFVAVTWNKVMTSPDGITWTERQAIDGNWTSITYGTSTSGPLFVVVGTNKFMTSPNGITWTERTIVGGNWESITYGTPGDNPLFVAVGSGSKVITSPIGIGNLVEIDSMKLTFNNNSDPVFLALSNVVVDMKSTELKNEVPISAFDIVTINGSSKNNYSKTVAKATVDAGNTNEPPFYLYLYLNPDNAVYGSVADGSSNESGQDITITINQFKTITTDTSCSFIPHDIRTLVGDASNFLRFTHTNSLTVSDTSGTGPNIFDYTDGSSLNFTVSYWDEYNPNLALGANIFFSNAIALAEYVPPDWTYNEFGDDEYIISLGTPVLPFNGNIILERQNLLMPPIGFIDTIRGSESGSVYPVDIVHIIKSDNNYSYGPVSGNLSLYTNGSIILSDIEVDVNTSNVADFTNANAITSISWGTFWQNPTDGPFKYLKPGNKLELRYNLTDSDVNNETKQVFVVSEVVDGNHFIIDSRESTISSDIVLPFNSDYRQTGYVNLTLGNAEVSQLVSDRYNFAAFDSTTLDVNSVPTLNIHNLREVTISNSSASFGIKFPIISGQRTNNRSSLGGLDNISRFTIDNTNIQKNLDVIVSGQTTRNITGDFITLDYGSHLWVIPSSNIFNAGDTTNISFSNVYIDSATLTFTTSNTISSATSDLSVFSSGQIINLTGATDTKNNGFFKISNETQPTSSLITLDNMYGDLPLMARTDDTGISIATNTLNSSNPTSSNLALFLPGQKLIITKTANNNDVFVISPDTQTSNNSLYLSDSVITETPQFCNVEKSIIINEISTFTGDENTTFDPVSNTIVTTSSTDDFTQFAPGQTIVITNTDNNNGTYTLENIIPGDKTLYVTVSQTETDSSAVISKKITLIKLGEPAVSVSDTGTKQFHYLDAQGNHLMLGSFAGQFTGATSLAVHNTHIGGQVGQTNQGSGNILLGNETGRATTSTQGATSYNNKLAIYKQDFVGVPSQPLIGGDFGSGRVGINTIDPDSLVTGTLSTATKLVINGAARASSFNTFTGTHMVDLTKNIMRKVRPGMILRSIGTSRKLGIIDTIVQCDITNKAMDKAVYGVYCHNDVICKSSGNPDEPLATRISIEVAYCASVGEGCILISDIGGELENGDYVMSSPIAGYAQLQPDDIQHTYTVAKITEDINWSDSNIGKINGPDGKIYKTILASCTYHCG